MTSVKHVLGRIGVDTSGVVSVLCDMFGFLHRQVPKRPQDSSASRVSLLGQIRALRGGHIHLNIITIGYDGLLPADAIAREKSIDYGIYRLRQIFAPVRIGVGRVLHWGIPKSMANATEIIDDRDEIDEIRSTFATSNDGLDAFVVINSVVSDGTSCVDGPCDKSSKNAGVVTQCHNYGFARTLSHEIGHYLGLHHNHDDDECPDTLEGRSNLMAQDQCRFGDAVDLDHEQMVIMHSHCSIKDGIHF